MNMQKFDLRPYDFEFKVPQHLDMLGHKDLVIECRAKVITIIDAEPLVIVYILNELTSVICRLAPTFMELDKLLRDESVSYFKKHIGNAYTIEVVNNIIEQASEE